MRFATVLCLGILVALTPSSAQNQLPTFTSSSENVSVFTTVTDKSGRLVTDLTRDDFQVLDEGKPQPLKVFDKTPQPIRLIVLIDVSGSMWGNLPLVRAAAHELIGRLLPGDLMRVATFGSDIHFSPNFTRDEGALFAELPREISPRGGTPLWQATDMAMNELKNESGRRVILILSDGKDTGPVRSRRFLTSLEIGERAESEDVMIYGVGMQSREAGGMLPRAGDNIASMISASFPDPALGKVALQSGGGYFELRARDDFGATFARVADELHQQYLLGFTPPKLDGKTHKLEVKVARTDAKVRARKTYRAPKAS
jgi:Ca-activated chloride channel family protein